MRYDSDVVILDATRYTVRPLSRQTDVTDNDRRTAAKSFPDPLVTHGHEQTMTAILGISAFYHDSAAALVVDGEIIAAAQEERFTRKKHDHNFPHHAVQYCLEEAKLTPEHASFHLARICGTHPP